MADTTFVHGTVVQAAWLNDANDLVYNDIINVKNSEYGAVGDGVTDDTAALQAAIDALIVAGGTLLIPPGTYRTTASLNIAISTYKTYGILGYGATILPDEFADAVFKCTGGNIVNPLSVFGVKIDVRGNGTVTEGWDLSLGGHGTWRDCVIEGNNTDAAFAGWYIHPSDPADNDTGYYWATLDNCRTRKRSSGDTGTIGNGVVLQGSANATTIRGGSFSGCTKAVKVTYDVGYTYIANGVLIDGVAFEANTTGIYVDATTTVPCSGLRVVNCRAENMGSGYLLDLVGATTQPAVPTYLSGNHVISSSGYLNNANSLYVQQHDASITPELNLNLVQQNAFKLTTTSGSNHTLNVQCNGGNRGMTLSDASGNVKVLLVRDVETNIHHLSATSGQTIAHSTVSGISATTTRAKNLRGQAILAAGTATVTFATAETNTTYYIVLSGNASETFYWASKTTSGFTINSSNGASTATVDWVLIR